MPRAKRSIINPDYYVNKSPSGHVTLRDANDRVILHIHAIGPAAVEIAQWVCDALNATGSLTSDVDTAK